MKTLGPSGVSLIGRASLGTVRPRLIRACVLSWASFPPPFHSCPLPPSLPPRSTYPFLGRTDAALGPMNQRARPSDIWEEEQEVTSIRVHSRCFHTFSGAPHDWNPYLLGNGRAVSFCFSSLYPLRSPLKETMKPTSTVYLALLGERKIRVQGQAHPILTMGTRRKTHNRSLSIPEGWGTRQLAWVSYKRTQLVVWEMSSFVRRGAVGTTVPQFKASSWQRLLWRSAF